MRPGPIPGLTPSHFPHTPKAHLELGFPERPLKPYVSFGRLRTPSVGCADRANFMKVVDGWDSGGW